MKTTQPLPGSSSFRLCLILLLIAFLLLPFSFCLFPLHAQSPGKMSYQAVVRNEGGQLVTNTQIGIQISILQGTSGGTVVYSEVQTPTTNANGLLSIDIGGGAGFGSIDWAAGPYFIKTEIAVEDPLTTYAIEGASQLLSVPYALHSKTVDIYTETDPEFSSSPAANITTTDITNLGNLSGTNTGDQDISALATKTALGDSIAQVRSEIPDVSGFLISETDPAFTAWDKSTGISITESQISDLGTYLETETDPVYGASVASGITATDTTNWNKKLDSFTETDPAFTAWDKDYNDLTNTPNIVDSINTYGFDGQYGSLTGTPTLATIATSGNYNDLSNKPDLSAYATKNMANENITNLADPVNAQDAVTKAYVDKLESKVNEMEVILIDAGLHNSKFKDSRDGYVYDIVKIGNQIWMAENLKFLPSVTGPAIESNITAYYYVYGYNGTIVADAKATSNFTTYGVLYNWPAAMNGATSSTANPSGVQGICPTGWHLPSEAEWIQLTEYLGGTSVAGGKLKETGTTHWNSPNTGATNETGFTALPGGYRYMDGFFAGIGSNGLWWSATESNTYYAWYRYLSDYSNYLSNNTDVKEFGFSVRCIKD